MLDVDRVVFGGPFWARLADVYLREIPAGSIVPVRRARCARFLSMARVVGDDVGAVGAGCVVSTLGPQSPCLGSAARQLIRDAVPVSAVDGSGLAGISLIDVIFGVPSSSDHGTAPSLRMPGTVACRGKRFRSSRGEHAPSCTGQGEAATGNVAEQGAGGPATIVCVIREAEGSRITQDVVGFLRDACVPQLRAAVSRRSAPRGCRDEAGVAAVAASASMPTRTARRRRRQPPPSHRPR